MSVTDTDFKFYFLLIALMTVLTSFNSNNYGAYGSTLGNHESYAAGRDYVNDDDENIIEQKEEYAEGSAIDSTSEPESDEGSSILRKKKPHGNQGSTTDNHPTSTNYGPGLIPIGGVPANVGEINANLLPVTAGG